MLTWIKVHYWMWRADVNKRTALEWYRAAEDSALTVEHFKTMIATGDYYADHAQAYRQRVIAAIPETK